MIGDLERRLRAAEAAAPRRATAGSDGHRRRVAVSRFESERARALADPSTSRLCRARYERGMSQRALSILAGCSRDALSRAERGDPRVSLATWRRLATALQVPIDTIRP
jgi:DNA-binding XRE family transcriptional regulator